jgi:hypothetical protein
MEPRRPRVRRRTRTPQRTRQSMTRTRSREATTNPRSKILAVRESRRRRYQPQPRYDLTDERARFVLGWWHRMHSGRRALVAVALKPVVWRAEGVMPERCLWEVCKWPQRAGFVWHFVCWSLDGVGAWWKAFPSKRAAMTYFHQAPGDVMARAQSRPVAPSTDGVRQGMRCAAAS